MTMIRRMTQRLDIRHNGLILLQRNFVNVVPPNALIAECRLSTQNSF